jgi:hypothetical protein
VDLEAEKSSVHRSSKKPVIEAEKVEPSPVVEPHRSSKKLVRDEQPVVKSLVVEGWVHGSGFGSGRSLDWVFCWLVEG